MFVSVIQRMDYTNKIWCRPSILNHVMAVHADQNCSKTLLQQYRISKVSQGYYPRALVLGEWMGGIEERGEKEEFLD